MEISHAHVDIPLRVFLYHPQINCGISKRVLQKYAAWVLCPPPSPQPSSLPLLPPPPPYDTVKSSICHCFWMTVRTRSDAENFAAFAAEAVRACNDGFGAHVP